MYVYQKSVDWQYFHCYMRLRDVKIVKMIPNRATHHTYLIKRKKQKFMLKFRLKLASLLKVTLLHGCFSCS